MTCPVCKAQIPEGSRFCENCGARIEADEPSVIAEEPAFIAEEAPDALAENVNNAVRIAKGAAENIENAENSEDAVNASAVEYAEEADRSDDVRNNMVDSILKETLSSHSPEPVLQNAAREIPSTPVSTVSSEQMYVGSPVVQESYTEPQRGEVLQTVKRRKKLNLPASIALCVLFGIFMTVFSAVSVAVSSVRHMLVRGAVSEYVEDMDIGDIVVGDTDLADEIVDKSKLTDNSTVSDVVKITLEDYEKYIVRGMFERHNVTVDDLGNIGEIDLASFADRIDGINGIYDLNIDIIIENIEKFDRDEINAIMREYSDEEFKDLTFEIDKRRIDDLLNKKTLPLKAYLADVVRAYENYMLTGEDTKPFTEEKLNALSKESVAYVLENMDRSYINEINKEMAQVVSENKIMLNSYNPSSVFGLFGNIAPMSLSIAAIFIALGLAVIFAVVAALVTKRIDAAALTFGISLMLAGVAALSANSVPDNLVTVTGTNYQLIDDVLTDLVKDTIVEDLTAMGVRALVLGFVIVAAVVAVKLIARAVRNKKLEEQEIHVNS